MPYSLRPLALVLLFVLVPGVHSATPTDNPVATIYSGPEGYPAWTDVINWVRVIDMKTYAPGTTAFEKARRVEKR